MATTNVGGTASYTELYELVATLKTDLHTRLDKQCAIIERQQKRIDDQTVLIAELLWQVRDLRASVRQFDQKFIDKTSGQDQLSDSQVDSNIYETIDFCGEHRATEFMSSGFTHLQSKIIGTAQRQTDASATARTERTTGGIPGPIPEATLIRNYSRSRLCESEKTICNLASSDDADCRYSGSAPDAGNSLHDSCLRDHSQRSKNSNKKRMGMMMGR